MQDRASTRRRTLCAAISATLISAAATPPVGAADVTSTWNAFSGNWDDPSRWINNPPVSEFPNNGNGGFTYHAQVTTGTTVVGIDITLDALTLAAQAGLDAFITGSGNITTTTFTHSGGRLGGNGSLTADTIHFTGGPVLTRIPTTVNNLGTATWTGTSGIFGQGTFNNLAGALFDCQNDGADDGAAFGVATINNAGTFRKSAGTETRIGGMTTFNNTGTVEVNSGRTLAINGVVSQLSGSTLDGGTWKVAGTFHFPGAIATIAAGASVTLEGFSSSIPAINGLTSVAGTFELKSRSFTAAGAFNSSGTVHLGNDATLTLPSGGTHSGTFDFVTDGALHLSGGTHVFEPGIQFTGNTNVFLDAGTLTVNGAPTLVGRMQWNAGTLDGPGSLGIAPNGNVLFVSGAGAKTFSGTINSGGSVVWNGTTGLSGSGTLNIQTGGILEIQSAAGAAPWASRINNEGVVVKLFAAPTTIDGPEFNSPGTVSVSNGTLNINAPIPQRVGTMLADGDWRVFGGATLNLSGGPTITTIGEDAYVTLLDPDSAFPAIDALSHNEGGFALYEGRVFTSAGDIHNSGLLVIGNQSMLRMTGTLRDTDTLVFESTGRLDLTDQKLITSDFVGTWNGSAYTGIAGRVDSGRGNAGSALWDGVGIITSDTRAIANGDLVSIGVARVTDVRPINSVQTTLFAGQTVLGSDTIAMVTWGGDANLDGKINIDDYGRIDANVGQSGSVFGWSNGDFNYDGKINIDDYGIIDGNINRQGTPFSTIASGNDRAIHSVAAVPEPVFAGGIPLLARLWLRRRRPTSA